MNRGGRERREIGAKERRRIGARRKDSSSIHSGRGWRERGWNYRVERRRSEQGGAAPISALKQELLKAVSLSLPRDRGSHLQRLQLRWREAAGELSHHSWPCRLQSGRLTVKVENSVYLSELRLVSAAILEKLQSLNDLNDLKLTKLHFIQGSLEQRDAG